MKTDKKRNWRISFRHQCMWRGWRSLIHMYGRTRVEAEAEAKKALCYYEGTTRFKLTSITE